VKKQLSEVTVSTKVELPTHLRILSDLHLEHILSGRYDLPVMEDEHRQVLILAGDIGQGTSACPQIGEWSERFHSIIYVAGNHEFYNGCIDEVYADINHELSAYDNVHLLRERCLNVATEAGDVCIWGSTFWTDMGQGDWHIQNAIAQGMNDFKLIKRFHPQSMKNVKFKVSDAAHYNYIATDKLKQDVAKEKRPVVVVTHHAPSQESSCRRYAGSMINCAYYSTHTGAWLAYSTAADKIKLWVHGHMHNASDYVIGNTRVVCNPKGYPGEKNGEGLYYFDPCKVVDVESLFIEDDNPY